jgi:hypothetical protein
MPDMPEENRAGSAGTPSSVPIPDPTKLTTDAVERLANQLRREMQFSRDLTQQQIAAMQEATDLRLATMNNFPSLISEGIAHLRELDNERFASIGLQFTERDIRTDQASTASSDALAAALQAAKELVTAQGEASAAAAVKSETSFTKQIDQIGTIITTLEKALDARITELKERIDRGEGNAVGQHTGSSEQAALAQLAFSNAVSKRDETRGNFNAIVALIGVLVAGVAVAIGLAVGLHG